MDEALRLAYLAAMEIPVWVLRGATETEELPEFPEKSVDGISTLTQPLGRPAESAPRRLFDELLGVSAPQAPAARRAAAGVTSSGEASAARSGSVADGRIPALLLVSAGQYLIITETGDEGRDRRAATLASAMAFALGGEHPAASMLRFDPEGSAMLGRGAARDMLLGRLARLAESPGYRRVIVLGPVAAHALLGWNEVAYAQRTRTPQRLAGLDADLLVTLAADALLHDPAAKAEAWRELWAAHGE